MSGPEASATADPAGGLARGPGGGIVPYRLSVGQFLRMNRAGILPESPGVELLGGVLVEQMTKNPPHNFAVLALAQRLRSVLGDGWVVMEEKSIRLGRDWLPEPDIAVVRGGIEQYAGRFAGAEDLALIVEVAEATYAKDRGPKWRRYAAVGVSSYWIVNLERRRIEIYGDPVGRGREAAYRSARVYGEADEAPIEVGGAEVGRVAVREVLPR